MRKKILFGLTSVAFGALLMLNISITSNGTSSDFTLQKAFMIASANDGEGGGGSEGGGGGEGSLWIKSTGNCSITLEGKAGVTVTLFGIKYTIPSSGSLTLTFSDVAVNCAANGSQMCVYKDCASFWQGGK